MQTLPMDPFKASKSFHHDNHQTNRFEATALKSRVQGSLVDELVTQLSGDPSGVELSHHLGLPEDGDLLNNLRTWCSHPDSTVFVLHSVLVSIRREDLADRLLQKMRSMTLCVMIQEENPPEVTSGPARSAGMGRDGVRFETVTTSCDTELGLALQEVLCLDLTYYCIASPGEGVSWSTKADQLRGKQLTLRHTHSPKRKKDNSVNDCNRFLGHDKKEYTDKSKVYPSEIVGPNQYSMEHSPAYFSDKKQRRMSSDGSDDGTLLKRPNTLPVNFNITSDEDGSPMIDIQKPPLELTHSPAPTPTSDASNMTPYISNLCVTPETEDSLDGHRPSYPVITSPSVASVDELEEYEIDEHTDKKVPANGLHFQETSRNHSRPNPNGSKLVNPPRLFPSKLVPSDDRRSNIPLVSPARSSMMDSVENLNEILGDFSAHGLTPSPNFNPNNTLNNLNSSSQTHLKESLQSLDCNKSIEDTNGFGIPQDNNVFKFSNPNTQTVVDHGAGKINHRRISDQKMEVDSAASSNIASNQRMGVTFGRSTSGIGSSAHSTMAMTDHSSGHVHRAALQGGSSTEYVPHHLVTQMSNTAEFADVSSQSVSFRDNNYRNNPVPPSSISSNESSIEVPPRLNEGSVERSNGDMMTPHPCEDALRIKTHNMTVSGNRAESKDRVLNDLSQSGNIAPVASIVESPPGERHAQPFFQPPPPPPYAPPPSYQRDRQQQQDRYQQHHQQQPITIQSQVPFQHEPTPRKHSNNIFTHTPLSSEEYTASDSEPPPYPEVVDRSDSMETGNPVEEHALYTNGKVNHQTFPQSHHPAHIWKHPDNNYPASQIQAHPGSQVIHVTNASHYNNTDTTMHGMGNNINMISSPVNPRRMPHSATMGYINTNAHQYPPSFHRANTVPTSFAMKLQDMKFTSYKNNEVDDTYLTVCDPAYVNTNINTNINTNVTRQDPVQSMAASKSLPTPSHHQQQLRSHPTHQPSSHQPVLFYNGGGGSDASDEGIARYNYIDNIDVSAAMAAAAATPGARGASVGGASKSLPHGNSSRVPHAARESPTRRPNVPAPPTPNVMSLEEQLSKVEGWMKDETDLTIEGTMEDYRCENGHFIVWRSKELNRFIITVSHNRVLNHFRVMEERIPNTDRIIYYVYKNGFRSESFLDLVNHYIQVGIKQPKVDPRMGEKMYDVIHIRLRRPLKVKIVHKRKA